MRLPQISPVNFRRRLALALTLPLVLMIVLAGTLVLQINHLTTVMQWVDHTDQVIAQANHTQKLLVDMETGLRGYLVTGNSEFLEPYQQASSSIDSAFNHLERLISDKPSQGERLRQLQTTYQQWYPYSERMITLRKQGGDYQAYAINAQGKQIMDTIRGQMASFIQTEQMLRATRSQRVQHTTWWVLSTLLGITIAMGGILALFIRRQLIAVAQSYGRALTIAHKQTEALQESEAALRRSVQRLAGLHEIDRSILAAESSSVLVHEAISRMRQLIPCQQAFVVVFNIEAGTAQILAGSADGQLNPPEGTTLSIQEFVPTELLQPTSRNRDNLGITESCPSALERLMPGMSHSCMTVPLLVEENLIGELILVASQIAAFAPEHQQIAQEVAAQLAIAIQQSSLREQLQAYTTELEQRVAQRTAALEETNAELESFSYSVSHDLRAPLRTMQGFTQALLEDYGDQLDSIGQDYARYIAESAVEMDTLISDLLAYSRLSRTEIKMQPVDLSSVMSDALSQMAAELQERKAEIIVEDPLPQVMAHRRTLIQVVINLLSNAIKFVELGVQPQVRVWVEEQQDCIRLWIVDNGLGIAVEHQERIFRVFERLHGIETYPGTGIGLAIVRKGMDRMGGRVGIESQIGQGSQFWLEFPKVTSHQQSGNG